MRGTGEEERPLADFYEERGRNLPANGDSEQDKEHCSLLGMWCHLNNCLEGLKIYGPSVTLLHVLARYNMSQYLSLGLKQG
jgi:hypothetical protein